MSIIRPNRMLIMQRSTIRRLSETSKGIICILLPTERLPIGETACQKGREQLPDWLLKYWIVRMVIWANILYGILKNQLLPLIPIRQMDFRIYWWNGSLGQQLDSRTVRLIYRLQQGLRMLRYKRMRVQVSMPVIP